MKFNNGYWLMQPGIIPHYAVEPVEVIQSESAIKAITSTKHIEHRGDTLNSPLLTITYSAPMKDVIKVQIVHHTGVQEFPPAFQLNHERPVSDIIQSENEISLISGDLRVAVPRSGTWKSVFNYMDKEITNSGSKNTAFIEQTSGYETPIGKESGEEHDCWVVEQLHISPGEQIYGLGERFTPIVKNGQSIELWNEDPGTASEQSYKNIPFYLSSFGYGVFINHTGNVSIEAGSEKVGRVSFAVEGQKLEYYIIAGDSLKEVVSNYTALTGRSPLPPAWTFGLWLSTSFLTNYDEVTVTGFLDGMEKREIPVSVFHFDCFWMKQYSWVDFHWDPSIFPDPKGMLKRIKGRGIRICVWINPYISQQSRLFSEAAQKGYLLKKRNGDIWQTDQWQAGMGIVDFTNPDAADWYSGQLEKLLDMGVDCFKTDFGERIPVNVQYHDNADPRGMHNYYSFLYNKTVFSTIKRKRGEKEAVVFARSATAGSQMFPVHWGGDCLASYDSMAESLRGGLSLCLSGFSFWSHDIGGFEHTATPDLYKRWTAFGLLSTHSRLHGSNSYRVPWNFDEEASEVLQHFTNFKIQLMPYLYSWAEEASRKGIPLMRHMILEFSEDPAVHHLELQYMLGPGILVAPVFNSFGEAQWYVPEGTWTHLFSGRKYYGPKWYNEQFDYKSLPLLARNGAIIPLGAKSSSPEYRYSDEVTIHIYEPENNGSFTVIESNGEKGGRIDYSVEKNRLIIDWKQFHNPTIVIHRQGTVTYQGDPAVTVTGEPGKSILRLHDENTKGHIELILE